jgi:hypothetical protein
MLTQAHAHPTRNSHTLTEHPAGTPPHAGQARQTYDHPTHAAQSQAPTRSPLPGAARRRGARLWGPGGQEGGSC